MLQAINTLVLDSDDKVIGRITSLDIKVKADQLYVEAFYSQSQWSDKGPMIENDHMLIKEFKSVVRTIEDTGEMLIVKLQNISEIKERWEYVESF